MWRRVWRWVTAPPHQKPVYAVAYIVMLWTGIGTLLMPPRTIEVELGPELTIVWALLMLVGGAVGALAILTRWWWVERFGIASIVLGISVYASVVTTLHFVNAGSRVSQLGLITVGLLLFVLRWLTIRAWSYEPPREE